MAINTEQKQRLRKLLFQVSPADGNEQSIEQIEEFNKLLKDFQNRLEKFDSFFEKFKKETHAMFDGKKREYEMKIGGLDGLLQSHIEKHQKLITETFKKKDKELLDTKEEFSQIVRKIEDGVRISYSKMGGGTMPVLIQVETPSFVPDGNTTVYYFKYLPTYITVGGQVMIIGDGYSQPVPLVDGYNVTFDNPPMPEQTVHNFHY